MEGELIFEEESRRRGTGEQIRLCGADIDFPAGRTTR